MLIELYRESYEIEVMHLNTIDDGTYMAEVINKAAYTGERPNASMLLCLNQDFLILGGSMSAEDLSEIHVICLRESWEINIMLVCRSFCLKQLSFISKITLTNTMTRVEPQHWMALRM